MRVNPLVVVFGLVLALFVFPAHKVPGLGWLESEADVLTCPYDDPYCNPYDRSAQRYAVAFESEEEEEDSFMFGSDAPEETDGGIFDSGIAYFKDAIKFKN